MIRIHAVGEWNSSNVRATWNPRSGRRIVPEIEAMTDAAWTKTLAARPGVKLFDGPMCRLDSFSATKDRLELNLSRTSYKAFLGTNISHPELLTNFGSDVMANPVGVSAALVSADDFLLLGRRSDWVAYYPKYLHPFAGALEPADAGDVFGALLRELGEEISFTATDVREIRILGVVEDMRLRHPELIFSVASTRTLAEIESKLDRDEHDDVWSIPMKFDDLAAALESGQNFTPVAVASMLLTGRVKFGDAWFDRLAPRFVSTT